MLPLPRYLLEKSSIRPCWFVGAAFGGKDDQTDRFIREKIWETNRDEAKKQIKTAQPGDRIAIKSTYVRKNDIPFDCNGNAVSVMAIKATGTILENLGNGRLSVDWSPCTPVREWYFNTYRGTVWQVFPQMFPNDDLIAFTFEGKAQNIEYFRNLPDYFDKYGDKKRFGWTSFYMAVADKLLTYMDRREELIKGIHAIMKDKESVIVSRDKNADESLESLTDICPFTVMALFNRGIGDGNRARFARELADFLGVKVDLPTSFEAIPVVDNGSFLFFDHADKHLLGDIDTLWEVFAKAIAFANVKEGNDKEQKDFCKAYDAASKVNGVKWNLSIGLHWVRPWFYPSLDALTKKYISEVIQKQVDVFNLQSCCNARNYLSLLEILHDESKNIDFPVYCMPGLSLAAYEYSIYTVQKIVDEGCFIPRDELDTMLERLREKKNLILQGPLGTGKTWLAKRLAYALTRKRDDSRIRAVQFHPSLSYEDFVRGWRPAGNGQLTLTDGPFMEMVESAHADPEHPHIVLIEEINRGNPAQILGEMLTLLEVDKRNPESALALLYRKESDERVYLPPNLYIIGTMNIADRSLALVDLALRRRFAFVSLFPRIDDTWQKWVHDTCAIPMKILVLIQRNLSEVNKKIAGDSQLGPQFQVGHSYVTPSQGTTIADPVQWFINVVETEIFPLLEEYWYENPKKAEEARNLLLRGF